METKVAGNTCNVKPIAGKLSAGILHAQYVRLKHPIKGWAYLINTKRAFYEGLSHNEKFHVFRYMDDDLQHHKPLLLKVSDTALTDFAKNICLPENPIL